MTVLLILLISVYIVFRLEKMMATVEEVTQALEDLKVRVQEVDATVEALYQALSDAQQGGQGATPEQLSEFLAKVAEIRTAVDAVETDNPEEPSEPDAA